MKPAGDRRRRKDLLSRVLIGLNISAWILIIPILMVFHRTQPEFETFFDRFYGLELRTFWDIKYLYILIYLVMAGIVLSLSGLLISIFRARRRNDHLFPLVIMGLVSCIFLIIALCHV